MTRMLSRLIMGTRRVAQASGQAGDDCAAALVARPERWRYGRTVFLFPVFVALYSLVYIVQRAEAGDPPIVTNAHAEQRSGTQLVDITYDVDDADGDSLTISVQVSSDGGATFAVPARTFSGDVGAGVRPGTGRRIVWDAGQDVPNTYGTAYVAKVIADDSGTPEGMALIPAGEFLMGDAFSEGNSDERPRHRVYLDAFLIDKCEVTNAQYKAFCDATGRSYPSDPGFGDSYTSNYFLNNPQYPVVDVSWVDASAYAAWAGKRLPTEAEWERAGRGGLEGKRYPWGDSIAHDANYVGTGGQDVWSNTSPVGSFPPNGYGLYDMAGNVWEYCADWYDSSYYGRSPGSNPTGSSTGSSRVLRGGSWFDGPILMRVASRTLGNPQGRYFHIGFRCAKSMTP